MKLIHEMEMQNAMALEDFDAGIVKLPNRQARRRAKAMLEGIRNLERRRPFIIRYAVYPDYEGAVVAEIDFANGYWTMIEVALTGEITYNVYDAAGKLATCSANNTPLPPSTVADTLYALELFGQ